MKTEARTEYITRDTIMKLLSDDEIARVATAETAAQLNVGDEYVDLTAPDGGVKKATVKSAPMGTVLPRKAVLDKTWKDIVILLAAHKKEGVAPTPS